MVLFGVLMAIFFFVDIPNSSGFLRSVICPLFKDLILLLLEILSVVWSIAIMLVKIFYKVIAEIVMVDLLDVLLEICYMPMAFGKIILDLKINFYGGLRTYFSDNSWFALLLKTTLIGLLIFIINSATRAELRIYYNRLCNSFVETLGRIESGLLKLFNRVYLRIMGVLRVLNFDIVNALSALFERIQVVYVEFMNYLRREHDH